MKGLSKEYKIKDNMSDSVGLITSILVRYPEVATIIFDPEQQVLKMTFILKKNLDNITKEIMTSKVTDSLEVYNFLEDREPELISIGQQEFDQFTLIEIQRDIETLMREEIGLTVQLFYDLFCDYLVTDYNNNYYFEEDLIMQEEIIEQMLQNLKIKSDNKHWYAFREEGRVLVFNK
ncbi:hypothetical protein Dtox_3100 [Desulfofarcimen acetoxidans DSM 771]|uniref:Uncharacterized protein n=1 Tax=Desulfofarcimen acetoxidans (strain ATCC 49208 / DSM 771 / KCTC 5769 / VKM B-1644 / 5575) TaxID=485916 RepID=C8W3R6_DESAS|nr:hypothetical protein Dtox_3100 [Desulfofarcimen acetoxidans DSM 771]